MNETKEDHVYATCGANMGPSSSPWSDLVEQDLEGTQYQEEVNMQMEGETRLEKRKGEDDDTEWTKVESRQKKKYKTNIDKIEIYISYSKELPKQFALARLFKDSGITDILRVKYINPYKVRLDMDNEVSAERLENCKQLLEKGWHIQRAMEKSLSYGVIRNVDLDLTDEHVLNIITCPTPAKLVSIFRLNRRNSKEGWTKSEAVRLCFKGSYIPPYISVDGLRIKVDPYVFPVSQCTQCWRLGHPTKRCSSKVTCPKCGENHANCDTTSFKCVNCNGAHMALYKGCPAFLKEKKLRDIMAEFNCTYRKALTIYVTPSSPTDVAPKISSIKTFPTLQTNPPPVQESTSSHREATPYVEIVKTKAQIHKGEQVKSAPQPSSRKQWKRKDAASNRSEYDLFLNPEPQDTNKPEVLMEEVEEKREREVNFGELIVRLKEIIFLKNTSCVSKITNVIKCCVEWIILVVVDNISDWPLIKQTLGFFLGKP